MVKRLAVLYLKSGLAVFLIFLLFLIPFVLIQNKTIHNEFVGKITANFGGPSAEEQQCVRTCASVGCETGDQTCMMANGEKCLAECGVEGKPEPVDEGESCMQECIEEGCGELDFQCQQGKMESCEEECDMKGDAPDESSMSEEQKCISECVAEASPETICQNSAEGEIGGRICKRCARDCEYLYAGPCIDDDEIRAKEKECKTCDHCYGEPVMGDSGEGWECIIDVQCGDSSSEFGDEAGEGPGIGQEGFVARVGDFFRNLFGGNDKDNEELPSGEESGSEN